MNARDIEGKIIEALQHQANDFEDIIEKICSRGSGIGMENLKRDLKKDLKKYVEGQGKNATNSKN